MAVYAPYSVPIAAPAKTNADSIYYGLMGAVSDPVFSTVLKLIISDAITTALTAPSVIAAHKAAIVQAETDAAVIAAHKAAMVQALTDAGVIAAGKASIVQALTDATVTAAQTLVIKNAMIDPAVVTAAAHAIEQALQDPATDAALIDVVEQGIYNAIDALVTAGIVTFLDNRDAALISLASAARKDSVFLQSNDAVGLAGLKERVDTLVNDVLIP